MNERAKWTESELSEQGIQLQHFAVLQKIEHALDTVTESSFIQLANEAATIIGERGRRPKAVTECARRATCEQA